MTAFNKVYDPKEKARAVARAVEVGALDAGREFDIPEANIRRWARDAGVALVESPNAARTAAATKAAALKRRAVAEESKNRIGLLLVTIAELGARAEIEILKDWEEKLRNGKISLRDIVGARTRALHDLAVMNGDATERVEISASAMEAAAVRDRIRERLTVVEGGVA